MISPIHSSSTVPEPPISANVPEKNGVAPQTNPQDTVTLSSRLQQAAAGDKDHDGDSK